MGSLQWQLAVVSEQLAVGQLAVGVGSWAVGSMQ